MKCMLSTGLPRLVYNIGPGSKTMCNKVEANQVISLSPYKLGHSPNSPNLSLILDFRDLDQFGLASNLIMTRTARSMGLSGGC